MAMYTRRVRVRGGIWTRAQDYLTTTWSEALNEARRLARR